jgi:hypothetical protein
MDFLDLEQIGILDLGAGGVVVLGVVALLKGWLFTRAHYEDVVAQRDKWEAAYWKEKEASTLQDKLNAELLETAGMMRQFLTRSSEHKEASE